MGNRQQARLVFIWRSCLVRLLPVGPTASHELFVLLGRVDAGEAFGLVAPCQADGVAELEGAELFEGLAGFKGGAGEVGISVQEACSVGVDADVAEGLGVGLGVPVAAEGDGRA